MTLREVLSVVQDVVGPGVDAGVTEGAEVGQIDVAVDVPTHTMTEIADTLLDRLSGYNMVTVRGFGTPHPMMLTGPVAAQCSDCKGSGQYVGLTEMRSCPTCGGSGHV